MHVLRLECSGDEREILIAELHQRGTSGVIEEELPGGRVLLQAFFDEVFPAADFAAFTAEWEPADETNWARKIMEDWDPIEVGDRFFVVPDWRSEPTPTGRIRLEVRPGVALGTGYHSTTQMCLEAMERYLRPGDSFLDLGAGSGILSHAAWLLGHRRIIATDTDPQATESAAANLRRSGVPAALFTGSTRAIVDGAAGFLVANISAATLLSLTAEISRCLTPAGRAVLSGFDPERLDEVRQSFESVGFHSLASDARDHWACLVVEKAGHGFPPQKNVKQA